MDARLNAANVILNRGVRFRLPAPFYRRLLKRDWVIIRPLKFGTILEISKVVLESGIEDAITLSDHEFLEKVIEPCSRCIAIAILNDKGKIARNTDKLTNRLMWNIAPQSIVDIFVKISTMNRVSDFIIITRYLLRQMTMMMNRRNLGQEEEGS